MAWKTLDTDKYGTEYTMENEGPRDAVELAPGDFFYDLYMQCKARPEVRIEEAMYFAITCRPGTTRERGERKIHRKLPSGREVRIWREHEAKNYPLLRQAMPGDVPADKAGTTNLHDKTKMESHEYTFQAQDAVFLAQMPNVYITRTQPRTEAPAGVYAPDQVCKKCGGPPTEGKKGFDHLDDCSYSKK